MMIRRRADLLCWLLLAATPAVATPAHVPVPGGVAVLDIAADSRPRVYFNDQRVMVVGAAQRWSAVVGIPLDTPPGEYRLRAEWQAESRSLPFTVESHDYPAQHITLQDRRQVNPGPAELRRIERETASMATLKRHWTDEPLPPLALAPPVSGRSSSAFGLRRFFNGEPRQPHAGLDIAAPLGTIVTAAARGRVSAVGDYFFNGRTVFIDHGQGLVTMYCHLDRVLVATADTIQGGDAIGAVGRSGRATGPHLHWSVYLNGAAVDPTLFLQSSPAP